MLGHPIGDDASMTLARYRAKLGQYLIYSLRSHVSATKSRPKLR